MIKNKENRHNYKIIIGLLLGLAIGSIGVYARSLMNSNEVNFIPNDDKWNVTKVDEALNDLYSYRINENSFGDAITNASYGSRLATRSASINVEKGKYIVTVAYSVVSLPETINSEVLNEAIDVACNSCTFKSLSNLGATGCSSAKLTSNSYNSVSTLTTLYYIETNDNDSLTFSRTSAINTKLGQNIIINAVKIN